MMRRREPPFFFIPETVTLTLDVEMLMKLERINPFLAYVIILHEFLHVLPLIIKRIPGLFLNLIKLRNESIVDLMKLEDKREAKEVKRKIVEREIVCNNLYLNSYEIFEALCSFHQTIF